VGERLKCWLLLRISGNPREPPEISGGSLLLSLITPHPLSLSPYEGEREENYNMNIFLSWANAPLYKILPLSLVEVNN